MQTFDGKPLIFDKAPMSGFRLTREGFLVADVKASRTGIYTYLGDEVGKPEKQVVRVYRPEDSVFSKETLSSFTSLDVTNDHPPELVNAKNWKKFAVGNTGGEIARDGEYVRVPLIIKDADTIAEVRAGKAELSFGYTCDLDFTAGKTPQGETYDAVQKNLRGNHLAIVSAGRAGSGCKIGDTGQNQGAQDMPGENLKTVQVDGIPVQTTDAGATVIDTLTKRVERANTENLRLVSDHAQVLKDKDAEIKSLKDELAKKDSELGTKDAELRTLKDAASNMAQFDQRVAERTELLSKVHGLGLTDSDTKGKSDQEIIRFTVTKIMGDEAIKGKSDDYIRACFDFLSKDKSPGFNHQNQSGSGFDPIRDSMRNIPSSGVQDTPENAHRAMVDRMTSAWQTPEQRQPGRA